jgi:transcriptional regulator with XRE-family HTH domain
MSDHPNKWRRARESVGFTREKAAELYGISVPWIKEIEKHPDENPPEPKRELQGIISVVCKAPWLLDSDLEDDYMPSAITEAYMQFDCEFEDVEKLINTAKRMIADNKIDHDERDDALHLVKELKEASIAIKKLIYSLLDKMEATHER